MGDREIDKADTTSSTNDATIIGASPVESS